MRKNHLFLFRRFVALSLSLGREQSSEQENLFLNRDVASKQGGRWFDVGKIDR